jgi:GH18 family chitinase
MKTKKAKELGMGGMMFWELDGDHPDSDKSLIKATKNELNNN